MFETLFKYPGVLARHRGGPFTDLREQFLIHCADQGLAHATLLHVANELLVVAGRVDLTAERQISLAEIEAAADEWSRYQKRRRRAHCSKWSRERFIQTAVPWLRFLGRFQESEHQQRPYEHIVQDFASFMRDERGLSLSTLAMRRCTSPQLGPTGRASCWKILGPSIPAAIPGVHQPRVSAYRKKDRSALALVATDTRPHPVFPFPAKNASTSCKATSPKERS